MSNLSMVSDVEFRGKWWLSDQPRRKIAGILKYTLERGLSLELDGVLLDFDQLYERGHCTLLGVSAGDDKISLHRCLARESKGDSYSRFEPEIAFVGAHFPTEDTARFNEVDVQFQHFSAWAGTSGIRRRPLENKGIAIEYTPEKPFTLASSSEYSISIRSEGSTSMTVSEASIEQKTILRFQFPHVKPFVECQELYHAIHGFLTLAMGTAPYPMSITARKRRANTRGGSRQQQDIYVLYQPITRLLSNEVMPHEMLFTLRDLGGDASCAIQNWVAKQELLRPVYDLFAVDLVSPGTYIENRLLNLFQATETYHRRTRGGKYQDDETYLDGLYKQLVSSIPNDVASDFRRSLVEGKLRYANEYSLRKRMGELLREHRPSLPDGFPHTDAEMKIFVERATDTRNYLTHYDDTIKSKVPKRVGLVVLEYQLRLLLEIYLLSEIGLEAGKIKELAQKSRTFRTIEALERQTE